MGSGNTYPANKKNEKLKENKFYDDNYNNSNDRYELDDRYYRNNNYNNYNYDMNNKVEQMQENYLTINTVRVNKIFQDKEVIDWQIKEQNDIIHRIKSKNYKDYNYNDKNLNKNEIKDLNKNNAVIIKDNINDKNKNKKNDNYYYNIKA